MLRPPGFPALRLGATFDIHVCRRCCQRLPSRSTTAAVVAVAQRPFSNTSRPAAAAAAARRLNTGYFLSNGLLDRFNGLRSPAGARSGVASSTTTATTTEASGSSKQPGDGSPTSSTDSPDLLPHRRRQAERKRNAAAAAATATATPQSPPSSSADEDAGLPTNASSILTEVAARQPSNSLRRYTSVLLSLAKPRLTVLVVLTAMAPYALYPVPDFLAPAAATAAGAAAAAPSLSPLTLLFLTTGTALCSASANALNMLYEPATDGLMSRTRNRPLVRGLVSRRAALLFAAACAAAGVAALHLGVNPTVAFLGAANIALYAGVYTPMKRLSVVNTWVGALVGGIPPLMGWAAAAGESATSTTGGSAGSAGEKLPEVRELLFAPDGSSAGGWLLAALLFAWQFPHFMALSWSVRDEYRAAGLRMLCWVDPARNARVALRYSLAFIPICLALCAVGVTEWSFAATSLPVNAWLVREAVRFWRFRGAQGSARGLFWASVWHLPVVMVLALLQKKGMWGRVWRAVAGEPEPDVEEEEDEDGEWEDVEEATAVSAVAGSDASR